MSAPPHGVPEVVWPLGQRDAHEAATACSQTMKSWGRTYHIFRRDLAAALVGAVNHDDMMARLDLFMAEFRKRLPEEPRS